VVVAVVDERNVVVVEVGRHRNVADTLMVKNHGRATGIIVGAVTTMNAIVDAMEIEVDNNRLRTVEDEEVTWAVVVVVAVEVRTEAANFIKVVAVVVVVVVAVIWMGEVAVVEEAESFETVVVEEGTTEIQE
jgi:hypothetical protein